jgi:hypothetical protein
LNHSSGSFSGPGKDTGSTEFESWNYESSGKLAELKKGLISDERDFRKTVEARFTTYYKPLAPYVNRLRRKAFPEGGRWRVPNPKLYLEMMEILRAARDDLKEFEEQGDISFGVLEIQTREHNQLLSISMWRWKCICFGRFLVAAFGGVFPSLSLWQRILLTTYCSQQRGLRG